MRFLTLLPFYVHWHYTRALKGIFDITGNSMWFIWHFFSIGLLASTLFAPFERLHEEQVRTLDVGDILSRYTINVVMRLTGAVVRIAFIVTGLIGIVGALVGGIVTFLAWLMLPFLAPFLIILGVSLLIHPLGF